MGKLRKAKDDSLPELLACLRIPSSEQKAILADFKRTFELEYDLYAGNIAR